MSSRAACVREQRGVGGREGEEGITQGQFLGDKTLGEEGGGGGSAS